jgi:DnaJ-class molecular chaperone
MARVRCACGGDAACRLCNGARSYDYEPGPRGWLPFPCPTCEGTGRLKREGEEAERCITCRGAGRIDPADPPYAGAWDVISKIFFGA